MSRLADLPLPPGTVDRALRGLGLTEAEFWRLDADRLQQVMDDYSARVKAWVARDSERGDRLEAARAMTLGTPGGMSIWHAGQEGFIDPADAHAALTAVYLIQQEQDADPAPRHASRRGTAQRGVGAPGEREGGAFRMSPEQGSGRAGGTTGEKPEPARPATPTVQATGPFQLLPPLDADEYAALRADIAALLNREQKRQVVAASVLADPGLSDREHARRCGVSPTTVGTVRRQLEAQRTADDEGRSPCAAYRVYGEAGRLLYVGQSHDPLARLTRHRHRWARRVRSVRIDWYPSRREAAAVEAAAIIREDPIYNVVRPGGDHRRWLRWLVADARGLHDPGAVPDADLEHLLATAPDTTGVGS